MLDEIFNFRQRKTRTEKNWNQKNRLQNHNRVVAKNRVECEFPMAISFKFRMRQHRGEDHQENAPHFITADFFLFSFGCEITNFKTDNLFFDWLFENRKNSNRFFFGAEVFRWLLISIWESKKNESKAVPIPNRGLITRLIIDRTIVVFNWEGVSIRFRVVWIVRFTSEARTEGVLCE